MHIVQCKMLFLAAAGHQARNCEIILSHKLCYRGGGADSTSSPSMSTRSLEEKDVFRYSAEVHVTPSASSFQVSDSRPKLAIVVSHVG